MTKHHRTAGKDFSTIRIDGKEYKLRPMTLGSYAEMEAFVVSLREDPLEIASEAASKSPANQHESIWRAAIDCAVRARTVTASEMSDFENSITGLSWKFWQCLKQDHPDIDCIDKSVQLISSAGSHRLKEIESKIHIATGEADLKN